MLFLHLSSSLSLSNIMEIAIFQKEEERNYFPNSLRVFCVVLAASSPLSFRLHPGERCTVVFGRMASHQHFVKVLHCELCTEVNLPGLSLS